MKFCYRCRNARPLADFIAKRNGDTYSMCSPCLHDVLTQGGSRGTKRKLPHTATHRICYLCRSPKPNTAFTRRSNGTYFSACKECNTNVFAHRRRARLLAAEGSFTTGEWLALLARHPSCPDCGRRWEEIHRPAHLRSVVTRDHVVPLAKGGGNSIENIRPCCYSCNSKKGDRQA